MTTTIDPDDPWLKLQFARVTWLHPAGPLEAKCKFVEEGRRCNAKMIGDDAVQSIAKHLFTMHDFTFNQAKRFSDTKGKRR